MGRIVLIGAGLTVATVVAVVVNLATSGGAWWLWLVLAGLVLAAFVIEVLRDHDTKADGSSQQIYVGREGGVEDSPQEALAADGNSAQMIRVRRKGTVRRSSQMIRRR